MLPQHRKRPLVDRLVEDEERERDRRFGIAEELRGIHLQGRKHTNEVVSTDINRT